MYTGLTWEGESQTAPFRNLWWHPQMSVARITVIPEDRWQASIFALRKARSFWLKHWQGFQLVSSWYRRTLYRLGLMYVPFEVGTRVEVITLHCSVPNPPNIKASQSILFLRSLSFECALQRWYSVTLRRIHQASQWLLLSSAVILWKPLQLYACLLVMGKNGIFVCIHFKVSLRVLLWKSPTKDFLWNTKRFGSKYWWFLQENPEWCNPAGQASSTLRYHYLIVYIYFYCTGCAYVCHGQISSSCHFPHWSHIWHMFVTYVTSIAFLSHVCHMLACPSFLSAVWLDLFASCCQDWQHRAVQDLVTEVRRSWGH